MRLMTVFMGMLLLSFGVASNGNAATQVFWTENFDYSNFSAFEANWDRTTVFFPGYPGFTEGMTTIENGQLNQEVSNNQKSEWKSQRQIPLPAPGASEPTRIAIDMIRLVAQGNAGSWLAVLDASGNGYAVQYPYDPFAGFGLNIREIIGWSGISPNHGSVPLSQDMTLHRWTFELYGNGRVVVLEDDNQRLEWTDPDGRLNLSSGNVILSSGAFTEREAKIHLHWDNLIVSEDVTKDTTPPTIVLNGSNPTTLECSVPYEELGAVVTDDSDPNPSLVISGSVDSHTPGTYIITYTAADASGNSASTTRTVNVVDTTPPIITGITATPNALWPPNHTLVPVTVSITASDNCSQTVTNHILSVTSNEPDNGLGDGDTPNDIQSSNGLTVQLRAERSGKGTGRIYTITVQTSDEHGNTATATVTVTVPKSQGRGKMIPAVTALAPNLPNPFNPTTQIIYDLPQQAHVTLVVYNLRGQEVVRLVDAQQLSGRYIVTWDGRNGQGLRVASGVYVYRLTTSTGFTQTRWMTLLK